MGSAIDAVIISLLILSGVSVAVLFVIFKYADKGPDSIKASIAAFVVLAGSAYGATIHLPNIIKNDDSYELEETKEIVEQDGYLDVSDKFVIFNIEEEGELKSITLNINKVEFSDEEELSVEKYINRFNREKYIIKAPYKYWK